MGAGQYPNGGRAAESNGMGRSCDVTMRVGVERGAIEADLEALLIGKSQIMRRLRGEIAEAATCDGPVLVQGETGVGKEVVAEALHRARGRGPFRPVNCGALGPLAESQLFGHARGAFTGADRPVRGELELAADGVLFLDEVGDLPSQVQVKLLRALDRREVTRRQLFPSNAAWEYGTGSQLPARMPNSWRFVVAIPYLPTFVSSGTVFSRKCASRTSSASSGRTRRPEVAAIPRLRASAKPRRQSVSNRIGRSWWERMISLAARALSAQPATMITSQRSNDCATTLRTASASTSACRWHGMTTETSAFIPAMTQQQACEP
jgi:Sigma-54 interaction domain